MWYNVVQDGTRWYKMVQTTVYGGTWRYKAIRELFKSYRLVRSGMNWSWRLNLGMLPCCWIRCCNSARPIALYWRLQHLITLIQAQACFNQQLPALPPIWLPPPPLFAGGVGSAGFLGGAAASAAGAGGGAGAAAAASAGGSTALALASSEGTGVGPPVSLGDELAGQVLGRWTFPSAGFLEDVVEECCERVAELYPKFVSWGGMASDFPHNNITLVSVERWIRFDCLECLPSKKKKTWRSIKNRMRGRNISCNNGFVVYLHFADKLLKGQNLLSVCVKNSCVQQINGFAELS